MTTVATAGRGRHPGSSQQLPTDRKVVVTRPHRRHAPDGAAVGASRVLAQALTAALALLAVAVAGPAPLAATRHVERPAQLAVGAHSSDAGVDTIVRVPVSGHRTPTATWHGPDLGTAAELLLFAALTAALFLSLLRLPAPASHSTRALPPRGPPRLAFIR
jgi:hypothetical protein